jgi:glycine cleavage system H protein
VNSGPFEDGWLMKVKLSDKSEVDDLMDAAEYKKTFEIEE